MAAFWRCTTCDKANLGYWPNCRTPDCPGKRPGREANADAAPVAGPSNHLYPADSHHTQNRNTCLRAGAAQHTVHLIQRNQFVRNEFVDRIAETPLTIYEDLLRRRAGNADFAFGELEETFANMERHLWRLEWAVCCGERYPGGQVDTWSGARIKREIEGETFGQLRDDIAELRRAGFPYQTSMQFMLRFMKCIEYIVFRGRSEAELQGSGIDPSQGRMNVELVIQPGRFRGRRLMSYSSGNIGRMLGELDVARRARLEQPWSLGLSIFPPEVTLADVYAYAGRTLEWPFDSGHRTRTTNLPDVLAEAELFIVPSYQPLDAAFFGKIRGVPIAIVGLIDMEFIPADGIRMSPLTFVDHDLFHIVGDPGAGEIAQQWHTLSYRLEEIVRTANPPVTKSDVRQIWDANIQSLQGLVKGDHRVPWRANLVDALNILLFTIFHEPIPGTRVGAHAHATVPCLPDPHSMRFRLEIDGIMEATVQRIDEGWFGPVEPMVKTLIRTEAREILLAHLGNLTPDPCNGAGPFAHRKGGAATTALP